MSDRATMAEQPLMAKLGIPDYTRKEWNTLSFKKQYEELFRIQKVPGDVQAKITESAMTKLGSRGTRGIDSTRVRDKINIHIGTTTYEDLYDEVVDEFPEQISEKILDFQFSRGNIRPYFTNDWSTWLYQYSRGDKEALDSYEKRNPGVKEAVDTLLNQYPLPKEPKDSWEQDKVTHSYKVLLRQDGFTTFQYSYLSSNW